MATQITNIKSFPAYTENPFVIADVTEQERTFRTRRRTVKDVDDESFFELNSLGLRKIIKVDSGEYCKVFDPLISIIDTFTKQELTLLAYIVLNVKYEQDTIVLYPRLLKEKYGKAFHIHRALSGLLEKQVIAKRGNRPSEYFINVNMFFKGRRTKL